MVRKLRILVCGASESNRRRWPSIGPEANIDWARRLEARNDVCGYWPAFLMHYLDAAVRGEDFPGKDQMRKFGRGRYLYDRSLIYEWNSAMLWNIGMPGSNSRFHLAYLQLHKKILRQFAPDVIIYCIGSIDCAEIDTKRTVEDLSEFEKVKEYDPVENDTFVHCRTPEEYASAMDKISRLLNFISDGRAIISLDLIRLVMRSRIYNERVRSFSKILEKNCSDFGHYLVRYPYIDSATGEDIYKWLRKEDNHPSDVMNAAIARDILEYIPDCQAEDSADWKAPVPVAKVLENWKVGL